MIEKVTLQLTGDSKLVPENGPDCGEMNPKTLLLYAAAVASILAGALVGLWLLPLVPRLALVFLSGAGLALLSCGAGGVLLYYKRKELFLT